MAICQYYLRGTCRYGDRCRNEHPVQQSSTNSFGVFSKPNQSHRKDQNAAATTIRNDMSIRPIYPLSSYGLDKEPNIIDGIDESQEELRLKYFQALSSGNQQDYVSYEANATNNAMRMFENVSQNSLEAYKYASNKTQPQSSGFGTGTTHSQSAFGQQQPSTSAFGQSAFGQSSFIKPGTAFGSQPAPSSGFGAFSSGNTSAFGQPSKPVSAFGQTSTPSNTNAFSQSSQPANPFGQSSFGNSVSQTSAFGQPSAFGGGSKSSTFGNTPAPQSGFGAFSNNSNSGSSGFGSSVFGKPSQPTSAFGQTSTPSATNAFGQTSAPSTSAFGQTSAPSTNAFGQASTPSTSAFGQTSTPSSAFGQSAFGQPSKPVSAFGQTSTPSNTNAFAQPSKPTSAFSQNAFGQTSTPSTNNAFGQPSIPSTTAFGQTSTPSTSSAFGQSAFGQTSTPAANVFGKPSVFGQSTNQQPQQQQQATSAFGQKPEQSAFSQNTTNGFNQSTFGQHSQPTSVFNQTNNQTQNKLTEKQPSQFNMNSNEVDPSINQAPKLNELPKHMLDAYKSDTFEWSQIPMLPPPVELR